MRVHLARLGTHELDVPVQQIDRLADLDGVGKHVLTTSAEDADVVLFPQCHMLARDWRLHAIRTNPLRLRFPSKVMVYDERDTPWCGFPGVYASMPRGLFQTAYQRAWGYFQTPMVPVAQEPDLLFSFVGSPTHKARTALFKLEHPDAAVREVRGFTFYDPSSTDFEGRRAYYRDVVGRSRFVLCPRGRGTSSIRTYETLAAGRVPVIIADDWVPPAGPQWELFSIRWPEGRTAGLVEMLTDRDRHWCDMSANARKAYEQFFAPNVAFHNVIELCEDLSRNSAASEFPEQGIRDRAYIRAGFDFHRHRTESATRRRVKRIFKAIMRDR